MMVNKYTIGGAIVGAAAGAVGGYIAATKVFADKMETKDPILALSEEDAACPCNDISDACDACDSKEDVNE